MISKKEKLIWMLFGVVLVFLFLLSSTDLIIKEEERRIYPISVIVEDTSDASYVNFRKGMDRAAIEKNADVSFITLYEEENISQQLALMTREEQDGAAALVVVPAGGRESYERIAASASVPLVMVWAQAGASLPVPVVTTDFARMGSTLAASISVDWAAGVPVYLFGREQDTEGFYAALSRALEEKGFYPRFIAKEGGDTYRRTLKGMAESGVKRAVAVGMDPESLEELAAILESDEGLRDCVGALYGRGSSISILNGLDRGIIRGVCVTDEFSAGYISIWQAVEAVDGSSANQEAVLESYYIEKEDLRTSRYEKMLYPIE